MEGAALADFSPWREEPEFARCSRTSSTPLVAGGAAHGCAAHCFHVTAALVLQVHKQASWMRNCQSPGLIVLSCVGWGGAGPGTQRVLEPSSPH